MNGDKGWWRLYDDSGEVEAALHKIEEVIDAEGYRRFKDILMSDDLLFSSFSTRDGKWGIYLQASWPERPEVEIFLSGERLVEVELSDADDPEAIATLRALASELRMAADRLEAAAAVSTEPGRPSDVD